MPGRAVIALLLLPGVVLAGGANRLPPYVLELPETVHAVLVAETEGSTLHVYARTAGGFDGHAEFYVSVGENGVGKERAWDRRTPLGVYFVSDRLDPASARLHERYGALALPLDYPNALDGRRGRSGDGIWIHGVGPGAGRRPARDTDGCLALANEDVIALDTRVQLLRTPVVIARQIVPGRVQEARAARDPLRRALDAWADAYRRGDWAGYLSAYAADFRYRGLDRDAWAQFRVQSARTRPVNDFSIDEIYLLADPEEDDIYLSRFRQTIAAPDGPLVTTKRLYWRRESGGAFRIVAEDNG